LDVFSQNGLEARLFAVTLAAQGVHVVQGVLPAIPERNSVVNLKDAIPKELLALGALVLLSRGNVEPLLRRNTLPAHDFSMCL